MDPKQPRASQALIRFGLPEGDIGLGQGGIGTPQGLKARGQFGRADQTMRPKPRLQSSKRMLG
jgi:hypothetical protein